MSYPPQPGNDPNNPYAQQPGQQPGYGEPQKSGLSSYGGTEQGYPPAGYGAPATMPGSLKAVRALLYVIGGLGIIGAIAMFFLGASLDTLKDDPAIADDPDASAMADLGTGVVMGLAVFVLLYSALAILCAIKVGAGNGWRITTLVLAAFTVLGGVLSLPLGVLNIAIGVLIIVFVSKDEGKAWYARPRH